jgi:hypothetical protein
MFADFGMIRLSLSTDLSSGDTFMIIIKINDGKTYRLCNDGRWRDFAWFGSMAGCVKNYHSLGQAKRVARSLGGAVVRIPIGMLQAADGPICELRPSRITPGYVTYVNHKLTEFIVWDSKTAALAAISSELPSVL